MSLPRPHYSIDADGYFQHAGRRLIPIGVNYWPGSTGVEMWLNWTPEEIKADLDVMVAKRLNTIRFFLRWQDFEPVVGQYSEIHFHRFREMLTWCRERKLHAHPSLFVGWMSGGLTWPSWCEGRNLFADPFMLERSTAFARRVGLELQAFADCVIAVDQGNELDCLPDCAAASPAAIANWCRQINLAVRETFPDCLMISGNDQQQVTFDTGWRLGDQPGCDLYSIHTYPVPPWHNVRFDGMTDRLGQSLLPFYVKVARTFGPVFVQEFGTILTSGKAQQDAYLRSILPAAWKSGAMGFLWWPLRDITAQVEPYISAGMETKLGLFDANDRVKPGLEYFLEFAEWVSRAPVPEKPVREIGLYFPRQYYNRGRFMAANDPKNVSRNMLLANHLLQEIGYETKIVRTAADLETAPSLMLISSFTVDTEEAAALAGWVKAGGRLLWHGPDPINWTSPYEDLIGAQSVDFRVIRAGHFSLFGHFWNCSQYPRDWRVQVKPTTAEVLAHSKEDQVPVVLLNTCGKGRVLTALCSIEAEIASGANASDPLWRDSWKHWYQSALEILQKEVS